MYVWGEMSIYTIYTFGRQYFLLGFTLPSRVPRTLIPIVLPQFVVDYRTITVYKRVYTMCDNTLSGQFAAIEITR